MAAYNPYAASFTNNYAAPAMSNDPYTPQANDPFAAIAAAQSGGPAPATINPTPGSSPLQAALIQQAMMKPQMGSGMGAGMMEQMGGGMPGGMLGPNGALGVQNSPMPMPGSPYYTQQIGNSAPLPANWGQGPVGTQTLSRGPQGVPFGGMPSGRQLQTPFQPPNFRRRLFGPQAGGFHGGPGGARGTSMGGAGLNPTGGFAANPVAQPLLPYSQPT